MSVFTRVRMPSLGGATEWLNSEPLGPAELQGRVAVVNFWTRDKEPPTHKPIANGRLKVVLPQRWGAQRNPDGSWQKTWSDGSRAPLEAKLDSVLRALHARAEDDVLLAEERARAQERRREEEAARLERERLQRIESARAGRLFAEVHSWRRSHDLREYTKALRDRLPELDGHKQARIEAWCSWAEKYTETLDPVRHTELIAGLDVEQDQYWSRQRRYWRVCRPSTLRSVA